MSFFTDSDKTPKFNPKEGVKIEGINREAYFWSAKNGAPPFIAYIFSEELIKEPNYAMDGEIFNPTLGLALNISEYPNTVYLHANTIDGRPSFLAEIITDSEKVIELESITNEIKTNLENLPTKLEVWEQSWKNLQPSNVDFVEAQTFNTQSTISKTLDIWDH